MKINILLAALAVMASTAFGGHGSVFSVAKDNARVLFDTDTTTGIVAGSGTGVFNLIGSANVNNLRNSIASGASAGEFVSEEVILESANTVSAHTLGEGSVVTIDWENSVVDFDDTSSSSFEGVIEEAIEIELAQ